MPTSRPCAAFEPISPSFDVKQLVESTPNFDYASRIKVDVIDERGFEEFEKLIRIHVILAGKPLVIEGYDKKLDRWTFALQWLRDNCAAKIEYARDLTKKANVPLSIGHYLTHMAMLTNQWTDSNYKEPARQRMYLKDIDCPPLWHEKLQEIIPLNIFYLNESVGDFGGLGSLDEADPSGSGTRKGRGAAKSGDLMSSLPKEMRAENLMCYIGHEGTYTPAHKEMCASLGQNIMVESSTGVIEDGKPTKPGSSIWFMTESMEREVVSEYWLSKLGHDIEVENHFAQINAWRAAPFRTYVVEQRVGDLILIPPLAPHQVWNRGTRTMKVAWNRTTVETLELALHTALPAARMVCRDEQYKNKAIIYYSLQNYSKMIRIAEKQRQKRDRFDPSSEAHIQNLKKDFRKLQALFTEVLITESFFPANVMNLPKPEKVEYDSNITCSYCRCNIFNRFLTCPSCILELSDGEQDTYDICMDCYAMGRSCMCISKLKWVEQWSWGDLTQNHEKWRHQILQTEAQMTDKSPKSLRTELEMLGERKTLAQVCQSELLNRPFHDIKKPRAIVDLRRGVIDDNAELDINGKVKKAKKPIRSEKFLREHARCHVDCHWEPKWKQAGCSRCDKRYCFGLLFRAYDMQPQDILANPEWLCPSCRNICSCRHCRDRPSYKHYSPSGTMLGHNTKSIADPRSVESLVDFSYSNISWIQKAGDDNEDDTRRMKKRQIAAEKAKQQDLEVENTYGRSNNRVEDSILMLARQEGIPIDPALAALSSSTVKATQEPQVNENSQSDEDEYEENPEQAHVYDQGIGQVQTPQNIIPAGGVIRDVEHAYENIEAITYDYPDPEIGLHAPMVGSTTPQDPTIAPGYEHAAQPNDVDIAMIERKRKRNKIDEDDLPFGNRPIKKNKAKKRKSLIVKLILDRAKLTEVQNIVDIAQKALIGAAAAEAPVISSDLQALNIGNGEGSSQRKKPRLEEPESEEDDFTPTRYRDRRKGIPEGVPRPNPDADITRRQTRMQVTNYEELTDDNDVTDTTEEELDNQPINSKLATMENVIRKIYGTSDKTPSSPSPPHLPLGQSTVVSLHDVPAQMELDPIEAIVQMAPEKLPSSHATTLSVSNIVSTVALSTKIQRGGEVDKVWEDKSKDVVIPSQTIPKVNLSKAEMEARKNQKAKMAALQWANDSSRSETESEEEALTQQKATQVIVSHPKADVIPKIVPEKGKTSIILKQQLKPKDAPAAVLLTKPKPASISSTAQRQPSKATLPKVSAADWGDSDSSTESDGPQVKKKWTSVNKGSISSIKPITTTKSRGQSARTSLYAGRRR